MPKRTIVITGARGGVGEQRHAGWLLPVTGLSSWGDPASKTNAIADELDAVSALRTSRISVKCTHWLTSCGSAIGESTC